MRIPPIFKAPLLRRLSLGLSTLLLLGTSSCLSDDDPTDEYDEWREANDAYITQVADSINDAGEPIYTRIVPIWEPTTYVLVKWHRKAPEGSLKPLDNSLVDITYRGSLYNGTVFDDSFSNTEYGDSITRTTPQNMVTGMHAALVNMAPGDSVTMVMPASAAYGSVGTTGINPYSTLIFDVAMKKIVKYDRP